MTPELANQIVVTARSYGLDPQLVLELMRQESTFALNKPAKANSDV